MDIADARVLLAQIKGNRETVRSLVVRHIVPGRELKASLAFADLWDSRHEAQ